MAVDLPDLHSFPTRRSSDLLRSGERSADAKPGREIRLRDVTFAYAGGAPVLEHFRSEEHTSELQSRFDLVCRLLLEKKNSRIYRSATSIPEWSLRALLRYLS